MRESAGRSRPKLLLVDDEKDLLVVLEIEFDAEGIDVTAVASGAAAVEAVRRDDFDVVVTDLKMPGMSGIDIMRAVRALAPDLPIIVVTGYASEVTELHLEAECPSGVVLKPFRLEQLLTAVRHALGAPATPLQKDVGV